MMSVSRVMRAVEGVEKTLALLLLATVLILTFAQVVARFIFSSPFFWTEELARYSYVWLSFIGSTFVMMDRSHITVEILDSRMSEIVRVGLNTLAHLAVVVTCLVIAIGTPAMVFDGHGGASPALGIPTTLFYGVVYASFVLMGIHAIINLIVDIQDHRHGRQVHAMGESTESAL